MLIRATQHFEKLFSRIVFCITAKRVCDSTAQENNPREFGERRIFRSEIRQWFTYFLLQILRRERKESAKEIERLRSLTKSENETESLKRELQFIVMTLQISLAQARADLAEVRTDLDLNFKSFNVTPDQKKSAESRVDSSPLCVTDVQDIASKSKQNRTEVN